MSVRLANQWRQSIRTSPLQGKYVYCHSVIIIKKVKKVVAGNFIAYPRYPGNYPSNVECVWLFKAPSKRQRHLTVEFHDLNIVEGCDDHVRVRFISRRKSPQKTKSTSGDPIRRRIFETMLCGSAKPVTYKNTRLAHLVEIVFKADSIHSSRGFRATFRGFGKTTTRDVIFDRMPSVCDIYDH